MLNLQIMLKLSELLSIHIISNTQIIEQWHTLELLANTSFLVSLKLRTGADTF
jgi:hypothetical protein